NAKASLEFRRLWRKPFIVSLTPSVHFVLSKNLLFLFSVGAGYESFGRPYFLLARFFSLQESV
ncbi:MAG: hypothetical protein AAFR36_13965, partial [Bacteroidota bacterium]